MIHPIRHAGKGLAIVLALTTFDTTFAPSEARAADDEERRALSLDEASQEQTISEEYRALAQEKRLESIDRLRSLLRDAPADDRKAEMMLRLADLYFEQGKDEYFSEMESFQKEFDECFNTSETGDECDAMSPDNSGSFGWYKKSIKLYEAILRGFPRYRRADQATFYLGMTHQEMGDKDSALSAFKKLVKLYPTSDFVPDAYVLIGEYYFEQNDAFPALRAYLKAASYKEHKQYGFAMYKLGWCYYNVEEYGKAIETMKRVVAFSMETAGTESNRIRLEEEALRDLVRFFADAGEMDEAYEYFTKLGKKELIRDMLKRLAGLYMEQGKFADSVETYRRLIQEAPTHEDNPGYQQSIIDAFRKMDQKDRVLDELRKLRTDYGRNSAWWRANASKPDAQDSADATIEKALRRTATDFNKEARELDKARHPRADQAYEQAIEAYQVYLEDYDDHPKAYAVHYDYGELLYKLKRYEGAYEEYMRVVDMDPKGKHSRFCAESAIFAAEEMVKKEGGGDIQMKKSTVTKDTPPKPLTDWEQRLIDACRKYADLYPGDKKVEIATYKSAFLLYSRFHFTEAAEQFKSVIQRWPDSSNAEFSAELILDALNIKEEWVSLRDTAKAFYEQENLGSKKFKDRMYDIYSSASFTVIEEDFKANENHEKTADAFVAFYEEFPDFEKVDFALNNAAAYYFKADRVADSMKVRHILVEDEKFGPKTKFYYRQVAALGFDYERLADFEKAAYYYDMLLELYPEEREKVEDTDDDDVDVDAKLAEMDSQAADALFTSAVFHNALGQWQGAIERYERFIEMFPSDERILDTRLTIAKIYEDHEQWSDAADAFEAFYSKHHEDAAPEYDFFARLHHGRALLAQDEIKAGRKVYAAAIDRYEDLTEDGLEPGAHTEFAAEMMFELTKEDAAEYEAVAIENAVSPGSSPSRRNIKREDKAMKDALQAKTGGLVELERSYTSIIETGAGEWGLAAIVALGQAYENMGETLTASPCPFYLTDDQCEIYQMTLEDRAYTQNEKAVAAYQLALDKSFELNLYNDNTAYATRALGRLRPEDFPGLEETFPEPGYTADKVRTFDLETDL